MVSGKTRCSERGFWVKKTCSRFDLIVARNAYQP